MCFDSVPQRLTPANTLVSLRMCVTVTILNFIHLQVYVTWITLVTNARRVVSRARGGVVCSVTTLTSAPSAISVTDTTAGTSLTDMKAWGQKRQFFNFFFRGG